MKLAPKMKALTTSAALGLLLSSTVAAGGLAGLNKATETMDTIQVWAFGFIAIVGGFYLLLIILQVMMEKKEWSEFFKGVLFVALAGATLKISTWAWTLFTTA